MKTKFKRYGKRTVSVILSLMMILSCMILGQIAPLEASADTTYYIAGDGITNSNGVTNNWTAGDSNFALTYVSSTRYTIVLTLAADVTFKMNKGSNVWIDPADQTSGSVTKDGQNLKNNSGAGTYLLCFNPHGDNDSGNGWVWLEDVPDTSATQNWYVTGTLGGSSVNAAMTSNGNSTYTYATGLSYTALANSHFKFKRVQEQGTETTYGSGANGSDWYLKTDTNNSNGPDHWLNLAKGNTKTYYFDGSSDQLVNLVIDESDISSPKFKFTLVDPNYTNISINAQLGYGATPAANSSVKFTNYVANPITTIASGTALDIEAPDTITDNGTTYYFTGWTVSQTNSVDDGEIANESVSGTTHTASFTPSVSGATVTAQYRTKISLTITPASGATNVNAQLSKSEVLPGETVTVSYTLENNTGITEIALNNASGTGTAVSWGSSFTLTIPDTNLPASTTIYYTTQQKTIFYIDAFIDNTYADYGASGTMYVKAGNGEFIEVGSSTYNENYPDGFYVEEGTQVTVKIHDNNYGQTNHNNCEYIIEGFSFSDPYKKNSNDATTTSDAKIATRAEAITGDYSFSFYPVSSIEVKGTFIEDKGTEYSGRYMLFSNNDQFWSNGGSNYIKTLKISKTVTNKYYCFITDGLLKDIGTNACYFGVTADYNDPTVLDSQDKALYHIYNNANEEPKISLSEHYINNDKESDFAKVRTQQQSSSYYGVFSIKNNYVTSLKIQVEPYSSGGSITDKRLSYIVTPTIDPNAVVVGDTGVEVLAKNGTIRGDYNKYANLAETEIWKIGSTEKANMKIGDVSVTKAYDKKAEKAVVAKGSTITIKTTVGSDYKSQYYVKAYNINGETYGLNENDTIDSNGVYTCEYTIDANTTVSKIEITPIYYYNEADTTKNKKFIKFYVENFDETVKTQWGKNTSDVYTSAILACYAWYGSGNDKNSASSDSKPALGGYPGQPMVYANGRYEMQVPQYANNGNDVIQGITLNNYVWDYVHSNVLGATSDGARETINCQTYDYDDFIVLATMEEVPDYIIFRFKYETTNDFYNGTASSSSKSHGNAPSTSSFNRSSFTNGFEYPFTDYYGNDIDIFNNVLTSEQIAAGANESGRFHIVSNGYEENYFGHFATRWYVYAPNGTYVGALPSSALLYYNESGMASANRNEVPSWFMENAVNKDGNKTASLSSQKLAFWQVYYDLYKGTANTTSAKGKPVEITYESAIRAEDYNSGGHPRDPALRNDGRWYYSRTAKINANIVIEYKPAANDDYEEDTYTTTVGTDPASGFDVSTATNPVGKITGAAPKFTNIGKYSNMVVASNVPVDPDNSFTFSVPSSTSSGVLKTNTSTAQTYLFEGWFIKKDGVYSPINETDLAKLTGSTAMLGETTLVARYTPMSGEMLTITHDLYKDAAKYENSPNAYGGSGSTYVTIDIVDGSGTSVGSITTTTNSPSSVSIDKSVLSGYTGEGYQDYKLKVTLTSVPDEGSEFNTLYRKTQSENGSVANSQTYTSDLQKVGYVAFSSDTTANTDAYGVNNWNSDRNVVADNTDNLVVYTCPISDLFSGDNLKTNIVRFYTDISLSESAVLNGSVQAVEVQFKYYDRDDSAAASSKAEDVDSTPTTVSIATYVSDGEEEGKEGHGVLQFADITSTVTTAYNTAPNDKSLPVSNISSVLDKYIFWMSQTAAMAENGGFQTWTNHHYNNNENEEVTYGGSGLGDSLAYHTNQYGYVNGETFNGSIVTSTEKWVSYYDVNGRLINYETESNIDPLLVNKVVVWAFNTPKQYRAKFYNAESEADINTTATVNGTTDIYAANTNVAEKGAGIMYYYNERVGVNYGGSYDDISGYLENVFSQKGYEGRLAASPNSQYNVTAQEITPSGKDYKYVFIGWYDENDTMVSADYAFQDRITSRMTLTARYKKVATNSQEEVTPDKGFTINQNQTEKFIDEDGDEYVRYAMMINGYGYEDSDKNIKKVALLQIVLPATNENGDVLVADVAIKTAFDTVTAVNDETYNLRSKIAGADAGTSVTADARVPITGVDANGNAKTYNCVVRAYVYNAQVVEVTNGTATDMTQYQGRDTVVIFTNKNRTQMTMIFNEDLVEKGAKRSDIVYFAAIGYDGYNVSNGTYLTGDNSIAPTEIMFTDGYVRYINGEGSSEAPDYTNN